MVLLKISNIGLKEIVITKMCSLLREDAHKKVFFLVFGPLRV